MTSSTPKVVAELSGNHKGSKERVFSLIELAHSCGVDSVKIQTYRPDKITINSPKSEFRISDPASIWFGRTLFDLYSEGATPWEWHKDIFEYSRDLGIEVFSTPFDLDSVGFLEDLGCSRYKIASFEITYKALIARVAQTKKPIIMSTGMASFVEIMDAVTWARENGASDITLLKCTSSYPAPPNDLNLSTMPLLGQLFDTKFGFSDHTMGSVAAMVATALGATLIEKHVTLDRSDGALDSKFSSDSSDLRHFVDDIRAVGSMLGSPSFGASKSEQGSLSHRRSIYYSRNLPKGHVIGAEDLLVVRPIGGLEPKFEEDLLGKTLSQDVQQHDPTEWSHYGLN